MSHAIEKRDKQVGIEMAWHGLTDVVDIVTYERAFPWGVVLAPVSYGVVTPTPAVVPHGKWVLPLASDDNLPLGAGVPVNLESYTLRTPKDLWGLRDQILAGVNSTVVSAGSVQNRAKYFVSTKLNDLEAIKLQDGSVIEILLNSMGSMDKSLVEQHSLSSTRIVCRNTLMMSFLGDEVKFRYRHSKNMTEIIQDDSDIMESVAGASAVIKAAFNSLINFPCNKDRAERIYTGLIVSEGQEAVSKRALNMIEEHVICFERGDGNEGKTEFDLLNGWTQPKTRGYSDSEKSNWSTFETSEFGAYMNQKVKLAIMLLKDRETLAKIEERGRALLAA